MKVLSTLRRLTGMNLARSTVEQAVQRRMAATGETVRKTYADTLDETELRELVELVVVPESWLFRDPQAFAVATEHVRRRLAEGAKIVRILSVPCAGGEEPYSMAMALCDAGVKPQNFMIDAVDISAACIARAQAGVFGRNAFRGKELSFRERYFTAAGNDEYRINEALRARIRFSQGSILEGSLGTAQQYDVVFCRNLLIYFDDPTTAAAIERLAAHLASDGMLLAGYAEVPSFVRNGFSALPHRQAFALRKDVKLAGAPARAALPARTTPPAGTSGAAATPRGREASLPGAFAAAAASPRKAPAPRASLASGIGAQAATSPATAAGRTGRPPHAGKPAASAPVPPPMAAGGDETLLAHARRLADAGKLAEAASACREFLAQQPDSAEAYFILGLLAEASSKPADAEAQLKRCLYLQPDHYEALCHLALLQEQGGNRSAAATLKARAARAFQRQQPQ
ncbi:tetratricopeptide repeat protein [Pseudoduganella eburnea]|uniref:Tetratricopeptide repeat protein n=1 Tax=Massilia eburnea TaxID=1776165 RepID=A0A6L6QBF4_9BURK|nr:protein-glutamate O-methyltransferase CheR [Massilia eburnea]MTW09419.1 tetratricopeptide repeat protein [Massilia eburnea]